MKSAFAHQISEGLNQKAVVFTESKRTQKYIAAELRKSGYSEEDILLFNGDFDDAMTKEIFRTWQVKNFGKTNYGRSVEYKHAIVDYFKSHAKILIVTDAGSEGLNLQFCNTIINYDLPWNPQKIEQRIGRCHRYGQTHDVVAINLLNTDNEADRRVYDILSKKFELFEGVFGASDVALGALESGVSFEKRILDIYQNCKNITAVRKAFAALNRQLDARKNAHVAELRSILLTESREAKGQALEKTKADIDKYLRDVEYWNQFEEPEVDHKLHYWKIDNWGEKIFGSHGVLFLGAFMDNTKLLFPVLLLCDENGEYINFTEDEIVSALEEANDSDVRYFKPTDEEQSYFHRIYARLISEVQDQHDKTVAPTIAYNKKKIENWVDVQQEQLHVQLTDAQKEVEEYILAEMQATDTLEKKDIRKKAAEAKKKMDKLQHDLPKRRKEIQDEAQAEIDRFNQLQEINPLLLINIVLKFYQHIYSVSRIDRSKNVIALFVGDTYDEIDSDIVQIDSRADVIIFSSSVVTAKMDLMQRFFGFEQYIRAGAQKTIEIIRDLDIVDSLEKFVAFENKSKLTNAKKLLKAKNSPVLQMKKNDLLENLKKHSRYKTMFKFEEDHIVISSQKEAAAFIKMLNDDIVRSELTGKEYDSSSKMLLGPVGASH